MPDQTKTVSLYTLSTCPWCRKTKQWFTDSQVPFDFIDVDLLDGEEGDAAAGSAGERKQRIAEVAEEAGEPVHVHGGEKIGERAAGGVIWKTPL